MMNKSSLVTTQKEIEREFKILKESYPRLKDDGAFVLWFLREHILDQNLAATAHMYLTGVSRDKGLDAIYIDDRYKKIHLVQGKFNRPLCKGNEKRTDVLDLANLADIHLRSDEDLKEYFNKIDAGVRSKLIEAIAKLKRGGYSLHLYYLTTKRISDSLAREAIRHTISASSSDSELRVYDGENIVRKFEDYVVGAAPAVPHLRMRIGSAEGTTAEGQVYKYDSRTKIETYIFPMSTKDVGDMYTNIGPRLFSRNIRGDLGPGSAKSINNAIRTSISNNPENF